MHKMLGKIVRPARPCFETYCAETLSATLESWYLLKSISTHAPLIGTFVEFAQSLSHSRVRRDNGVPEQCLDSKCVIEASPYDFKRRVFGRFHCCSVIS